MTKLTMISTKTIKLEDILKGALIITRHIHVGNPHPENPRWKYFSNTQKQLPSFIITLK